MSLSPHVINFQAPPLELLKLISKFGAEFKTQFPWTLFPFTLHQLLRKKPDVNTKAFKDTKSKPTVC